MFSLNFNENDLKIIDKALINMPYREVAGLIDNINQQLNAQLKNKDIKKEEKDK